MGDRYQLITTYDDGQRGPKADLTVIPLDQATKVQGPRLNNAYPSDYTVYIAREFEYEEDVQPLRDVRCELLAGSGNTALTYRSVPEIPNVGIAIHVAAETVQCTFFVSPTTFPAPPARNLDRLVSWVCIGRPALSLQRETRPSRVVGDVLALIPIPSFSERLTVRCSTNEPYAVLRGVWHDERGVSVGEFELDSTTADNVRVLRDITIPPQAVFVSLTRSDVALGRLYLLEWQVMA